MMQLLYLDPGSGSYLIQVIIAAVLGVIFYFKTGWNWIKSFFSKPKPETEEEKHRFEGALRRKELSLILAGKMNPKDAVNLKRLFAEE